TRDRALSLLADIVGQVLTVARMRASVVALCADLEGELGVGRGAPADQQQSLRGHEENIRALTQGLIHSNRVKREFLGTVSHELRTPLNAILGYTALVRDGAAGTLSGEQATLLDRVLSNTRSLNTLIDDILFFVQLEADRVPILRDQVRTAALVEAVMAELPRPLEGERAGAGAPRPAAGARARAPAPAAGPRPPPPRPRRPPPRAPPPGRRSAPGEGAPGRGEPRAPRGGGGAGSDEGGGAEGGARGG